MSNVPSPADPACLEARIRSILARGVAVGPEALGFIESTLPVARSGGLAAALAEASAAESEPVLALLFFPEESLQREIEEILAGRALSPEDEQQLALRLAEPPLRVMFDVPGAGERLELEMAPERVRGFLAHLRLTRSVPKELEKAITAALAPVERSRFRVLWRNARCAASGEAVRFLGRLLRRTDLREPDGWVCLNVMLEFLAEVEAAADIYRRLAARKAFLLNALNRSRRQRDELVRGNMETLISRGVRLVALDEEQARRHIACIDQACLAVYGRIEAIDIDTVPHYDNGN